eukprot:2906142-Rhodomonas_salina.1
MEGPGLQVEDSDSPSREAGGGRICGESDELHGGVLQGGQLRLGAFRPGEPGGGGHWRCHAGAHDRAHARRSQGALLSPPLYTALVLFTAWLVLLLSSLSLSGLAVLAALRLLAPARCCWCRRARGLGRRCRTRRARQGATASTFFTSRTLCPAAPSRWLCCPAESTARTPLSRCPRGWCKA